VGNTLCPSSTEDDLDGENTFLNLSSDNGKTWFQDNKALNDGKGFWCLFKPVVLIMENGKITATEAERLENEVITKTGLRIMAALWSRKWKPSSIYNPNFLELMA